MVMTGGLCFSSAGPGGSERPLQPISFVLTDVIEGWTEGIQLMKVGGQAKLSKLVGYKSAPAAGKH